MLLTARFYYRIAGLWVEKDVLGKELRFERGEYEATVAFPAHKQALQDEVGIPARDELESALGNLPEISSWLSHLAEAVVFKVTLRGELDVSVEDISGTYPMWGRREADDIAVEVADWARAWRRQSWLGLPGERPLMVAATWRDDTGAYNTSVISGSTEGCAVGTDASLALGQSHLAQLAHDLANRESVPLPELFLADARSLMEQPLLHAGRVVLAAAISVEIKTRETMRSVVRPDQLPLLDLIFQNPRDFSVAAYALLDKGMEAATGHSLRKEDRALYKQADELFQRRNDVAHRGVVPEIGVARSTLQTAEAICAWLDEIRASAEPQPDASDTGM